MSPRWVYEQQVDDLIAAAVHAPRCRCTHDTSDPERGCECGYADWLCDNGG